MRRLATDDAAALAELMRRWQRPVLGYVCRFLGCTEDEAGDIAQETFLRVWIQRKRWRPRASFQTWLFTIVGNLCRNRKRDLSRRPPTTPTDPATADGDTLGLAAPAGDDPHARVAASELASRVRHALGRLPANQRSALLLRRFQALSYREIAEILGTTPSAVDSLLTRARRTLAETILGEAKVSRRSGVEPEWKDNDAMP